MKSTSTKFSFIKILGPGLLVAATGVGAGDLAGGAFAGSKLGVAVLWAVIIGAIFKFVITEGLTRWQLATGETLLEGAFWRFGKIFRYIFMFYLFLWSFVVGSALISASGVAGHALFPVFDNIENGKIFFGILHSLLGLALVWFGKYSFFEKIMSFLIIGMFVTVIVTAIMIKPDLSGILQGALIPSIPDYFDTAGINQSLNWIIALIGGVGGTLTILCYGYWIREKNRSSMKDLKTSRIDLVSAYTLTALFGMAMIVIAAGSDIDKQSSSKLIINLVALLENSIGKTGATIFLIGAWGAIFSSLLGVWQSVPYLFADSAEMFSYKNDGNKFKPAEINTKGRLYRTYLLLISIIPIAGLFVKFVLVQKVYAMFGALVVPGIAVALLFLNGTGKYVGDDNKNGVVSNGMLLLIIAFFLYVGGMKIYSLL